MPTGTDVRAWTVLKPAALLFILVGLIDIAIAWHPLGFGRPEWEFATVTATLNGLPAPVLGLALSAACALALGQRRLARFVAAVMVLLAVAIIMAALLYATNIPIALQSVPTASIAHVGLQKAMAKTLGQAMLYPAVLVWMSVAAWRRSR